MNKETPRHCPVFIFTTFSDNEEADETIKMLFDKKLIACAQKCSKITSFYVWKGELKEAKEIQVKFTTLNYLIRDVESVVKKVHSYDTFQFATVKIRHISDKYYHWIDEVTVNKE